MTLLRFQSGADEFSLGVCLDDQDGITWRLGGYVEDAIGYSDDDYREILTDSFEDSGEAPGKVLLSAIESANRRHIFVYGSGSQKGESI